MDEIEIYKSLWASNDEFAAEIAIDDTVLPSLRVIALYLLHNYAVARNLYNTCTHSATGTFDDILLQEIQLMFDYFDGKELALLKLKAESIAHNADWSIFSRILIAISFERERNYPEAIKTYQDICSLCPSNIFAIAGLTRSYIWSGKNALAYQIQSQGKAAVRNMVGKKKRYWGTTFFIYGLGQGMINWIKILIGMTIFITAFFHPIVWIFPALLVGFCLIPMLFFAKKDGLAFSLLLSLVVGFILAWLAGYLTKVILFTV